MLPNDGDDDDDDDDDDENEWSPLCPRAYTLFELLLGLLEAGKVKAIEGTIIE